MALVSSTIPNLANGVSQQAPSVRLNSQAEEQVNGFSSVISGLRKRPPTELLSTLIPSGVTSTNYFIHTINRDVNERYIVLADNNTLRVFGFDGTEYTVNTPSGTGYLSTGTPETDFKAVTIADYTFILNKTVTVQSLPSTSTSAHPEAIVHCRQGNYATDYKIFIDDVEEASYTTSDTVKSDLKTNNIANQLATQLVANLTSVYTVTWDGSAIRIQRTDGNDFTLRTEDSYGNQALIGAKGSIQRFSDLPRRAFADVKMKVVGDESTEADNYYVKYVAGDQAEGLWEETIADGADTTLDTATMPWKLVREANGTFTFSPNTWDNRQVGDAVSAPDPSFVGQKINDVFFHRNRLGVIAAENVIFSRSGEFFSFYPETVTTVLATDPIDVAVSHTKVSILRHAIPFNETLLLFSDQTQFMLSAGDSLTPETVSINQTTEYESSLQAEPVGAGEYIYFATNREGYTGIREFFVQADTASNVAVDSTLNVPRYLKGNATSLVSNTNEDMLFVLTDGTHTLPTCYVYKYLRQNNNTLQMSWSKWEFPACDKILSLAVIESLAYWVMLRDGAVTLEKMQLQENPSIGNTDEMIYLDALTQSTTAAEGQELVTTNSVDYVGYPYEFKYTFSTQYKRSQGAGGSQITDTSGRLQMREFKVLFKDSGQFKAETITNGEQHTYSYTGQNLGSMLLGTIDLSSGEFTIPLMAKNDRISITLINDTHYPSSFQSAEWTAYYTTKSGRI